MLGEGNAMKRQLLRFMSVFCALFIVASMIIPSVYAKDKVWSSTYAYTLNSAMSNCGTLFTENSDGYIDISTTCPTGVFYADLVNFENAVEPCLVMFYTDGNINSISVDIYRYDAEERSAKIVTTVKEPLKTQDGEIAEIALAEGGDYRYVVFNRYMGNDLVSEEYYTVIENDAFMRVEPPGQKLLFGVASFTSKYLHPEVDISNFNGNLSIFFSLLKDGAAQNVGYTDILGDITNDEHEKLSRVLSRTAEFTETFDIGNYSTMAEYSLAVNRHNGNGKFNAITNVYDLGDELYYVRYSTDLCFYNSTVLRRTDKVTDDYQILNVRNDCIPFSDAELDSIKKAYMKNKLVLEKSGGMELKSEPFIKVNKLDVDKPLDVPQIISPSLRKPLALIGGGVLIGLFILLWVMFSSDDK